MNDAVFFCAIFYKNDGHQSHITTHGNGIYPFPWVPVRNKNGGRYS